MGAAEQHTYCDRLLPPDDARLAKQAPEPALDPDLLMIDPHHHRWNRPNHRYPLDDFLADVRPGHHLVDTGSEEGARPE